MPRPGEPVVPLSLALAHRQVPLAMDNERLEAAAVPWPAAAPPNTVQVDRNDLEVAVDALSMGIAPRGRTKPELTASLARLRAALGQPG